MAEPDFDMSVFQTNREKVVFIGQQFGLKTPDSLEGFAAKLYDAKASLALETNWLQDGRTPIFIERFFKEAQENYLREVRSFEQDLTSDDRWLRVVVSVALINNAIFYSATDAKTGIVTVTESVLASVRSILCPWYPWC